MSEQPLPYGPPPGAVGPVVVPGAYVGPVRSEPLAVVALVLAVLTWTPVVPFVGAVAALVLCRSARRNIETSDGRRTGLGLLRAARILSVVHLAALALVAVGVVLLLALPSFS